MTKQPAKPAAKKTTRTTSAAKTKAKTKPTAAKKPSAATAKADQASASKSAPKASAEAAQVKMPDPVELSKSVAKIAERSQKLIMDFMEKRSMSDEPQANMGPVQYRRRVP